MSESVSFEAQPESGWKILLCKTNELAWQDLVLPMSETYGGGAYAS